jgi:hypothetical protein
VLSQWADGSLDPRESLVIARHTETCAACRAKAGDLRAVGAWIRSASAPGPSCLSADDMAAVLEGGRVPAHVRTCPRCASEFRALRKTERKATRRRQRPPAPMTAWAAAAAIFIAVGLLLVVATQQTSTPEPLAVRVPPKPPFPETTPEATPSVPPVVKPNSVVPPRKKAPVEPRLAVEPDRKPVERTPEPPQNPIVKEPETQPTPVAPKNPARPTEVVGPPKAAVVLNMRAGGLSSLSDGKWVKATKLEDGMALRADGKTQIDFAQARITLDASSRFSISKEEFSLNDGGMSAEVSAGSKLVLVLEDTRLVPQAGQSRVIFCARADRIVVEEGAMKVKDAFLQEGVEHLVKKDRIQPQARRSMAPAARPRESVAWKMNLQNEIAVRNNISGHIERGAEGKFLASTAIPNGTYFYGGASYYSTGDEPPLFVAKPNTAVRFRYYMTQPGSLEFVMKNLTKDENFNKPLEPVIKQWTTVTLFARDVLANTGGKKVFYETGDIYRGVTWFVGKPGVPSELYIDRFEILEIER